MLAMTHGDLATMRVVNTLAVTGGDFKRILEEVGRQQGIPVWSGFRSRSALSCLQQREADCMQDRPNTRRHCSHWRSVSLSMCTGYRSASLCAFRVCALWRRWHWDAWSAEHKLVFAPLVER